MGGRAGFEMGCHGLMPTSHGGGGNPLSWLWHHVVKPAASLAYHASGADLVVGCIAHPTFGGCAQAAGAIVLTAATLGEGTLARMAIEGGARLAMRGLAVRAATRALESLGAAGRTLRYATALTRDSLNPIIRLEQVGQKALYTGNSFSGRALEFPLVQPVRLFGDHPIMDGIEGVNKGLEWFDRAPIQFQDQAPILIEKIMTHLFGG
jgi:hypothetical protein